MTTPAIDNSVAVLRALIAEDWDTFHRLHAAQDAEQRQAFAVVLAAAFVKSATQRFGEHPQSEDIIDFVSDARVRLVGPDAVVPENAERAIRAALGEADLIKDMDGRALGTAYTSVLFALAHENDTSAEMVTKALTEAAEEASGYLARRDKR
jgi:hypothetical protein